MDRELNTIGREAMYHGREINIA